MIFAALVALALGDMPMPKNEACGATEAENARFDAAALQLARKSFPDAAVIASCRVWGWSDAVVRFGRVRVEAGGVTFVLNELEAKATVALGEKAPLDPEKWKLVTPVKREALAGVAPKILAEPLTRLLSPKPICLVGRDHEAVGYLCRGGLEPEEYANTPSLGHLPDREAALEFLAFASKQCPEFALENFSLPVSKLGAKTRGWCALRAKGAVRSEVERLTPKERAESYLQIVRTSRWTAELFAPGRRVDETIAEPKNESPCPPLPQCP